MAALIPDERQVDMVGQKKRDQQRHLQLMDPYRLPKILTSRAIISTLDMLQYHFNVFGAQLNANHLTLEVIKTL